MGNVISTVSKLILEGDNRGLLRSLAEVDRSATSAGKQFEQVGTAVDKAFDTLAADADKAGAAFKSMANGSTDSFKRLKDQIFDTSKHVGSLGDGMAKLSGRGIMKGIDDATGAFMKWKGIIKDAYEIAKVLGETLVDVLGKISGAHNGLNNVTSYANFKKNNPGVKMSEQQWQVYQANNRDSMSADLQDDAGEAAYNNALIGGANKALLPLMMYGKWIDPETGEETTPDTYANKIAARNKGFAAGAVGLAKAAFSPLGALNDSLGGLQQQTNWASYDPGAAQADADAAGNEALGLVKNAINMLSAQLKAAVGSIGQGDAVYDPSQADWVGDGSLNVATPEQQNPLERFLGNIEGGVTNGIRVATTALQDMGLQVDIANFKLEEFSELLQDKGTLAGGAFDALTSGMAAAVSAAIDGSESIGQAFLKASAAALKGLAVESTVRAAYHLAMGIGSAVIHPAAAAGHFAASAKFAATAALAGVSSAALGAAYSAPGSAGGSGASAGNATSMLRPNADSQGPSTVIINVHGNMLGTQRDLGATVSNAIEQSKSARRYRSSSVVEYDR